MERKTPRIKIDKSAVNVWGEYKFTEEEIKAMSKELASKNIELGRIDNRKKAVMADFKAKSELVEKEIESLSTSINSGVEYRDFRCFTEFDLLSMSSYTPTGHTSTQFPQPVHLSWSTLISTIFNRLCEFQRDD